MHEALLAIMFVMWLHAAWTLLKNRRADEDAAWSAWKAGL